MAFFATPQFFIAATWGVIGIIALRNVAGRYGWGAAVLLYGIYLGNVPHT